MEQKNDDSVLISEDGLVLPFEKTGVAHLSQGEEFIVACPGDHNKLLIEDTTEAKGICLPNGSVKVKHSAS